MNEVFKIIIPVAVFVFAVGILGRIIIAVLLPSSLVTSWWRDVHKNRTVGGHRHSLHLLGWAYDITPVTKDSINKLKQIPIFRKVLNEGDHIHVQIF